MINENFTLLVLINGKIHTVEIPVIKTDELDDKNYTVVIDNVVICRDKSIKEAQKRTIGVIVSCVVKDWAFLPEIISYFQKQGVKFLKVSLIQCGGLLQH